MDVVAGRDPRVMEKPAVFTTGSRVLVKYRSPQETRDRHDLDVSGYVVKDTNDVLVVEEYRNFTRENKHRHALVDTVTKDLYSQTRDRTQRLGQAVELQLMAPPWSTLHDTTAGGLVYLSFQRPAFRMIREGIYKYPDPDVLDQPADWSPKAPCEDPVPQKIRDRNADTVYAPQINTDAV